MGAADAMADIPAAHTPLACLKAAGLSGVGARGPNVWRGFHREPFFSILVKRYPTVADARQAVRESQDNRALQANRYVVTAPSTRWGMPVAVCLRRG